MTWKVSNVVSQRIEFVVRAIGKRESVREALRRVWNQSADRSSVAKAISGSGDIRGTGGSVACASPGLESKPEAD